MQQYTPTQHKNLKGEKKIFFTKAISLKAFSRDSISYSFRGLMFLK
jgi:hypothetical protein